MDYILFIATLVAIYSILTITMNILVGYIGILYLAHPAVYGVGAYTFAILAKGGTNYFLALLAAGAVATILGLIIAMPTLKLKSHYIGMSTLGFLIICHGLFINLKGITRGALGIPGIPRPTIFGETLNTNLSFFIFTIIITTVIGIILHRILHSPFSKTMEIIREDETAAKTLGKNIIKYKLQAFMITSFFGGIGGGLLASLLGYISPTNFNIDELVLILTMVIIGGMASFWGSIVGATIIILIPEALKFLDIAPALIGPLRYGIYGMLIILFMIYKPNGILGRRTNVFSK